MNEKVAEQWMTGFAKIAADAGITDPAAVDYLVKVCGRLAIASQYPEQFEAGVKQAAAETGMEKAALIPLILGGLAGLGGLGYGAYAGIRDLARAWKRKTDPYAFATDRMREAMDPAMKQWHAGQTFRQGMTDFGRQMGGAGGGYEGVPRRMYPTPYGYGYGYGS